MDTPERIKTARAIRECLRYLTQEAKDADLSLVDMHLRIAIVEAQDFLEAAEQPSDHPARDQDGSAGGSSSGRMSA